MSAEYDRWLDAFDVAYRRAGSAQGVACPGCGRPGLRLVFLVETADCMRGTAVFWCDRCLRGLTPLRSVIPDGAEPVLRDTEAIPNYTIVPDH